MLGNYFRELLEKHNRVIIPDFGAFLVKDTGNARSITDTSFSPFLRYNDGLVEAFLAEKEGLTKADATVKVKEYVDSLKARLNKGEKVLLPQLGYFYQDARGTIQFHLDLTGSTPAPTPIIKEEEKPEEPEIVNEKEIALPTAEKEEVRTTPTPEQPAPTVPAAEEKQPVAPPLTSKPTFPPKKGKPFHRPTPPAKKPIIQTKKVETSTGDPNDMTKSGRKSKSKGYWFLIVGLIVILFIVTWQYDNIVKVFNSSEPASAIVDTTKQTSDSLAVDSAKINADTAISTPKANTPKYVKPVIDKPENKFLVVVGSFANKLNAEAQLNTLSKQGYQPIIIMQKNGLHSVVISGHTTKEEAKLSLETYTKKNGAGWIMTR